MPHARTRLSSPSGQAAATLLAVVSPLANELSEVFAAAGYELALVGGPVRDAFLGRHSGDIDLTTDAPPDRVQAIVNGWADHVWPIVVDFGTIGLRK